MMDGTAPDSSPESTVERREGVSVVELAWLHWEDHVQEADSATERRALIPPGHMICLARALT